MQFDEYINSLAEEAKQDLGAAEALAAAGYHAHALFFSHLVLEKLGKALWIKRKNSKDYPYVHNLLRLLKDASIELTDQRVQFYSDMNLFQAKGRYPDTLRAIEGTITKEVYVGYRGTLSKEIEWLMHQLQ